MVSNVQLNDNGFVLISCRCGFSIEMNFRAGSYVPVRNLICIGALFEQRHPSTNPNCVDEEAEAQRLRGADESARLVALWLEAMEKAK